MGAIAVAVGLRTNIEPERSLPPEGTGIDSEKLESCGGLATIFGTDSELRGYPNRRIALCAETGSRSSSSSSVVFSSRDSVPCDTIKGPRPMACAAISRRRLRSSTSSSWGWVWALISMTPGRMICLGGCRIGGLRRPNLKLKASEAATKLPLNLLRPLADPSLNVLSEEYDVAPLWSWWNVSLPVKVCLLEVINAFGWLLLPKGERPLSPRIGCFPLSFRFSWERVLVSFGPSELLGRAPKWGIGTFENELVGRSC